MKIKLFAAAAVVSLSAFATQAQAVAWNVTTSGTIQSGYDYSGVFGVVGDLTGLAFTQSITANVGGNNWSEFISSRDYTTVIYGGVGPAFSNTVTINGITITFASPKTLEGRQRVQVSLSGNGSGFSTSQTTWNMSASSAVSGPPGLVSTKNFDITIAPTDISGAEYVKSSQFSVFGDGLKANFYGVPDTVSVHPADSVGGLSPFPAIPEPETYAMMLVGLGLVGAIARRKPTAA